MMIPSFDILIIGGGPGGYVAALRATQLKLRTALVEREHLGGVCLNWGCIPTKSLLHTADTLRRIRHAHDLGLTVAEPRIDFQRVMKRSRETAQRLHRGVTQLLHKAGVTVFHGHASFAPDHSVVLRTHDGENHRLEARHTIIATGARARELQQLPLDGDRIWSYREALTAQEIPRSLVVIGAGAIGMEFASFYATLGTQVTVVETQPRVLPTCDHEVSAFVAKVFAKDGIQLRTNARIQSAEVRGNAVHLLLETETGPEMLQAERALVAVGLAGNTEGLGLEHTQVRVDRGLVVAGDWGATADPVIHAIGDVTGPPMLAHRASHQGLACIERIAGLHANAPPSTPLIPSCVYCHPQSASIGLTEEDAKSLGRPLHIGRFPLEANGKAIAIGETSGFVKTIFDTASGELLGAHIAGADAPELIQGFALASTLEATEEELMETVFPHPTLSEALHESVLAAFNRPLHI